MGTGVRDHFRAHGRRKVSLAATVRRTTDAGSVTADAGRLVDLSLGGACVVVHTAGAPYRDAAVALEIMAPTLWDPLVVQARVMWIRGTSEGAWLGLRFDHGEGGALPSLVQLLGAHVYAGS